MPGEDRTREYGRQQSSCSFDRTSDMPVDSEALALAIKAAFSDVLLPGQTFFLQIKSEEWGGVFVDIYSNNNVVSGVTPIWRNVALSGTSLSSQKSVPVCTTVPISVKQEIPDKTMIKAVVTNVQKPEVGICCFSHIAMCF